jgi:transposase-like protein
LFCPNRGCPMYGKVGAGNIRRHGTYGSRGRRRYACKTCGKTFSETKGTAFYNLRRSMDTILQALAMLVERDSIRGTARAMGVKKDTVSRWLERAAKHSEEVSQHLMENLKLTQVQVDEIWAYIKKGGEPDPRGKGREWRLRRLMDVDRPRGKDQAPPRLPGRRMDHGGGGEPGQEG